MKQTEERTKGVLLLALGHPYYGRMAVNLAMSIKFSSPHMDIALAYADEAITHMTQVDKSLFCDFIKVPKECYTRGKNKEYIKAKTAMYKLSPFDETIFLDADMVFLPKKPITELFDSLKGVGLTFQNRGFADLSDANLDEKYSMWANVKDVKKAYKIKEGKYYQLHSEMVYFEKSKKNEKFFNDAIYHYDNLKVDNFLFAGAIPDELPFAISMMLNNIYPHESNYTPVYWEVTEKKNLQAREMYQQYYAYSCGGSHHTKQMKEFYDNLTKYYGNQLGVQHTFPLQDKRSFLPERKNI